MKLKGNFTGILILLLLNGFVCADANAAIKFLPANGNDTGGFRAPYSNSCLNYDLSSPNCQGKKCEEGWICDTCTNSSGTYYKCQPADTPLGYTVGLTVCEPCNEYLHKGFTGDFINGRCMPIKGCSQYRNDSEYTSFQYVIGVEVGDDAIRYIEETGYKKN